MLPNSTQSVSLWHWYRMWEHICVAQQPLTITYMSMMTMSVFSIDASSWMKFLTTVVTVSNVIPPQIMICLQYKQNPRFCILHTAFQSRIFLLRQLYAINGCHRCSYIVFQAAICQPFVICYTSLRTFSIVNGLKQKIGAFKPSRRCDFWRILLYTELNWFSHVRSV